MATTTTDGRTTDGGRTEDDGWGTNRGGGRRREGRRMDGQRTKHSIRITIYSCISILIVIQKLSFSKVRTSKSTEQTHAAIQGRTLLFHSFIRHHDELIRSSFYIAKKRLR